MSFFLWSTISGQFLLTVVSYDWTVIITIIAFNKTLLIFQLLIWLLVPLLAVMMNSSILGAWIFYIPGRDYRLWENVLYASLHRIGWAVPVAFVIVADAYIAFGKV